MYIVGKIKRLLGTHKRWFEAPKSLEVDVRNQCMSAGSSYMELSLLLAKEVFLHLETATLAKFSTAVETEYIRADDH